MNIYTGAQLTINGILDEKIQVRFNNHDGEIGLVFTDSRDPEVSASLSYAAAIQLIDTLQVALQMKRMNFERKEKKA